MDFPICAVCQKPVEKMEWFHNPITDVLVYRAYCHGDVQEIFLPHYMVEDSAISVTTAFSPEYYLEEKKNVPNLV
jgi:hypothetical protein